MPANSTVLPAGSACWACRRPERGSHWASVWGEASVPQRANHLATVAQEDSFCPTLHRCGATLPTRRSAWMTCSRSSIAASAPQRATPRRCVCGGWVGAEWGGAGRLRVPGCAGRVDRRALRAWPTARPSTSMCSALLLAPALPLDERRLKFCACVFPCAARPHGEANHVGADAG